jgi:hypothetical protein
VSEDDFLWPPETFEDNADPALAQKLQHSMDIIFAQLRRLQTSAAGSGLPEPASNGDIIRRDAGEWVRLGIGIAGQALIVVSGLPEWSNDGHELLIDADNIDQGVLPTARYLHDVLSAPHQDSTPASAVLGDLIVAQSVAAADVDAYWLDGLPYDEVPNVSDAGDEAYWVDGLPAAGLETAGSVTWQRKPNSTTAGYVLTSGATGPDWQPIVSSSAGAAIYRSADLSVSAATQTVVDLDTSIFNDGFWTSGSRLTVPTGQGGRYAIVAAAAIDYGFVGDWHVYILVNGTIKARVHDNAFTSIVGTYGNVQCCSIENLNAGDYVELGVQWDYGGGHGPTFNMKGGLTNTFLKMVKL